MRTIFRYMRPYALRMGAGLTIKLFGTVMDLVLPWALAYTIDTIVPTGSVPDVYRCGAFMVVCAVIAVTFNISANRMAASVSAYIIRTLRHDLFRRITALSFRQSDRFSVPSLVSRLSTDTYNVHQMIDRTQRMGVRAPMLLLGGLIMTFALEPSLAVILLIACPLLAGVVVFVSRKGIPLYTTVQRAVEGLVRTVRENAAGVRVIKALSKSEYERTRFDRANRGVAEAEKRAGRVMAISNPVVSFLLNAGLMAVILVGAMRVDAGLMQPGVIIAFLSYFTIILNATLSITRIFVLWSRGTASAKRIEEVLLAPETQQVLPPDAVESPYHIEFDCVSFSYNGRRDNLSDVSFRLRRGETLGIFGPTGAGKTTLVLLLMRFYDADAGTIRIDGEDVRTIDKQRLRGMFGAVFQNDVLLADSVYENISFLRDLPMADVLAAADTAQAADFIAGLPQGYDTPLDIRGQNLSGGQRQRILIARALAGRPEILILDDAESALDYRTDAAFRRSLRRAHENTTTVVISERVSALMHASCILVLDEGRITHMGTHDELMACCPGYRRIAEVQMGGGDVG